MSTTIDERVVEMRFDNKQFESNVATSMSTLDKLKQKLNLQGTSKGLEDLGAAAKKVDMSALGGAVENVKAKFSAMDVAAVTALANITNSAVNAGKRMVSALTIDPVKTGFKEYETQINAVQTILANTSSKGTTLEQVNSALDELNHYADKTIYNFTEMTKNIGTFTAAGIDLDTSVSAIQGIANLAAVSGSTSQQASTAMYQLSQALASGTVKLMDWNSVVNAGMGGEVFQNALKDTARVYGVAIDKMIEKEGSFRATLSKGWLTSDILTQTLKQFTMAAEEGTEEWENYKKSLMDTGYTEEQANAILKMATTATDAATKVKTFTQLWDTLKEAAQSGWTQTWELIVGDFEEAKESLTSLSDFANRIIGESADRRNSLLGDVFGSGWDKLTSRIKEAGIETDAFEAKVKEVAKASKAPIDQGMSVDALIKKYGSLSKVFEHGKLSTDILKRALDELSTEGSKTVKGLSVDLDNFFKQGQARTLSWGSHNAEAVKKVQTALTELGFELPKFGIDGTFKQETRNAVIEFQKSVGLKANGVVDQKTIDALQKAGEAIETTGEAAGTAKVEIDDLIDSITRPSGRDLIFDIISNSLRSVASVLDFFRIAWSEAFSEDEVASGLYNALKAVRDFTDGINSSITEALSDEKVITKLANTFKGLGAVVDIVTSFVGGGVKLAFKSLSTVLGAFNFDILGVTSNIGDLLVAFRDWVLGGDRVSKIVDWLVNQLSIGINIIKGWGDNLQNSFKNTKVFTTMSEAVTRLGLAFGLLKEGRLNFVDFVKEIGTFCSSIIRAVPLFDSWINSFNNWLETFKQTESFQKLSDAVTRLSLAFSLLKEGKLTIFDFIGEFGTFISSIIDAIPILKQWKNTFTGWIESFKNLPAVQQFTNAIEGIRDAFTKLFNGEIDFAEFGTLLGENLGEIISSLPDIIKQASGGIISAATQIGSDFIEGFKNGIGAGISSTISSIVGFCTNFISAFASALGVHSPSVIAYSIGAFFIAGFVAGLTDNEGSVIGAIKQLGEGITTAFKSLIGYLTDEAGNIQWDKIIAGGMTISTLVVLNKFANAFNKIAGAVTSFSDILKSVKGVIDECRNTIKVFQKTLKAVNLDILAGAAMKIAISVGILVASIWVLAQIDDIGKLWNAVGVVVVLCAIMAALAFALSKFSEANVSISKDGVNLKGLQTVLVQIGIAILLLAATAKLIGSMQPDQLKQGFIGLAGVAVGLILFIAAMGKISKAAGDADVSKLGTMMLKISAALIVMVIAMKMISKMDAGDIVVGVAVLEAFVLLCMELGVANRIAGQNGQNFGGNVLKIAVAMGALVIVMKMVAKMDPGDILKGIAVLQAFVILIGEMAVINRLAGGATSKIGGTVMSMATSMMILAGTLWLLSSMDESAVDNGIRIMQKFVLLIAELTLVSQLGRGSTNVAANILAMSTAIGILAGIAVVLSLIPLEGLAKGIAAIGMLGAIMSLMIWATRGANDVKGNLIAMTVAIAVMAAAVVALSFIDSSKLAGSVAALGTLMVAFGIMMKLAGKAESSWKMVGAFTAMMGVVLALTGVIIILSQLDPKAALPNAIALGILLTAFAGALAIMGHAGTISKTVSNQLGVLTAVVFGLAMILALMTALNVESAIPNAIALGILLNLMATSLLIMGKAGRISKTVTDQLGVLTVVVGGLAIILALMTALNVESAIPNAIALGILLNLMATSLAIMGHAGKISKTVSDQLVPLTAVVAGLAIILGILGALNIEASIPTAIALGILLNALASAMVILGFAGPNASKAVPAAMLMGVVLGEIALVLGVLAAFNIQPSIETALALSTLLLALSAACLIVSLVPAPVAISGALGLAAFVGVMAGVVTALGLLTKIPGFTEVLSDGGKALGLIGQAIGNFVGGIVAGVSSAIISVIPQLGMALSAFAIGVKPFIALISGIDASVIEGAAILAGAIIALTAADFIAAIGQFLSGGLSFSELGAQLSAFGAGVMGFAISIKGIDAGAVDSVNCLASMILALTASDILSGLKEFFGGGSVDFAALGTQLQQFGDAVVGFSQTISGNIDTAAVQAAVDAGNMLVALNQSLPRSGGWLQDIIGEKDFNQFATACDAFLKCIMQINATLSQNDCVIQSEKITQLATAGTQLSDLNNALPRSGGIAQDFAGEQDLSRFATAVMAFATCMITINATLSDPNLVIQSDKLKKLATAGTQLSDLNNALPRSGGIAQDFAGEQDLSRFGAACKTFADCMVKVNEAISQEGFAVNLTGIDQLKQAGEKIKELQDVLPKTGGWWQEIAGEQDIGDFGTKIGTFATAITDFSTQAQGLDSSGIDLAIQTAYRIKNLAETLKDIDYSGITEFTGVGTGGFGADGPVYKIGKAIAAFGEQVAEIDTERVNTSVTAARQIRNLISSLTGLDTSGIENFKPEGIGSAMKGYSDKVAGIDPAIVAASITSANRLKTLVAGLVDLDTSGVSKFNPGPIGESMKTYANNVGDLDVATVSASIAAASRLKNFVASLAEFDNSGIGKFNVSQIGSSLSAYGISVAELDFASISASIAIATRLSSFVAGLTDLDTSGISNFKVGSIGSSLSAYAGSVSGLDIASMSASVSAASRLATFIASLAGLDTSGVASFKSAIDELSKVSIDGLTDGFSSAASKLSTAGTKMIEGLIKGLQSGLPRVKSASANLVTASQQGITSKSSVFMSAGSMLIIKLASGISKQKRAVDSAVASCVDGAAEGAKDQYQGFYSAGAYLVDGFAAGISENTFKAAAQAKAMAEAAEQAAREALDINSPSKVFKKIGSGVPEGFAMGIGMLSRDVKQSVVTMSSTAIDTTRSAMTDVLTILNSDVESQPTIRPVVDLTDVRSGANNIGKLLNTDSSIGVTANLNAVSSMMRNRQNGNSTEEVVSAIDKLRRDLGKTGNTTYTIGGITYDDGSNISAAVKDLVRAARVERRV